MNKKEFIEKLEKGLSTINKNEREKTIQYYEESIHDRMEDGLSEEEAVKALGNIDDIIDNIMCEKPLVSLLKTKVSEIKKNSKSRTSWLLLIILGFPLWFPLLIAFAAIAFVIYLSICIVVFSFMIVLVAFAGGAISALIASIFRFITYGFASGGLALAASLILAGLAIILFEPCKKVTKAMWRKTLALIKRIKRLFLPKREV